MENLLTVSQAADYLQVTRRSIFSWVRSGRLKAVDISEKGSERRLLRFRPEHLEELCTDGEESCDV